MVAMFIIFDFVIKNPLHPETRTNLSFLDIVAAHFARLDLASEGTLHDMKVAEFTSIARFYVDSLTKDQANRNNSATSNNVSIISPSLIDESYTNLQQAQFSTQQSSNDVLGPGSSSMVSGYTSFDDYNLSPFHHVPFLIQKSLHFSTHHHQLICFNRSMAWTVGISQQELNTMSSISPTCALPCICLYRSLDTTWPVFSIIPLIFEAMTRLSARRLKAERCFN